MIPDFKGYFLLLEDEVGEEFDFLDGLCTESAMPRTWFRKKEINNIRMNFGVDMRYFFMNMTIEKLD